MRTRRAKLFPTARQKIPCHPGTIVKYAQCAGRTTAKWLVERGERGLAEALAERDRTGVHETKVEVGVGLLQLGGAGEIGRR